MVALCVRSGIRVREARLQQSSLEEVFRQLTGADMEGLVTAFWAIYRREMLAAWVTPLAWVMAFAFLLLQGVSFYIVIDHYTHFTA